MSMFGIDAPTGAYKTTKAIYYLLREDPGVGYFQTTTNVLMVQPTKVLLAETRARILSNPRGTFSQPDPVTGSRIGRRSAFIHCQETSVGTGDELEDLEAQSAAGDALGFINKCAPGIGAYCLVTTANFLNIAARIERPGEWTVILDESFEPLQFLEYELGLDEAEGRRFFDRICEVGPGGLLTPRGSLAKNVADGSMGSKYHGVRKLSQALVNPLVRSELLTGVVGGKEKKLWVANYVTPEAFECFSECIFLSALFRSTVLYMLWTRAHGVEFKFEHAGFKGLRETHREQGPNLRFHYLFHADDGTSAYNLKRHHETFEPYCKKVGSRVIDRCIETVLANFPGPLLMQVNNWVKHRKLPDRVAKMPVKAHGLNSYSDFTTVACLASCNPDNIQREYLKNKLGLSDEEVLQAVRIHSTYQGMGRCALRVEGNSQPIDVIVLSKVDAEFLHGIYPGSTMAGQVGHLARFTTRTRQLVRAKDLPEFKPLDNERRRIKAKAKRGTATEDELLTLARVEKSIERLKIKCSSTVPDAPYESPEQKRQMHRNEVHSIERTCERHPHVSN